MKKKSLKEVHAKSTSMRSTPMKSVSMKRKFAVTALATAVCGSMLTGCGGSSESMPSSKDTGAATTSTANRDSNPEICDYVMTDTCEYVEAEMCDYIATDTYGYADENGDCIENPYGDESDFNTEEYEYIEENGFVNVADNPLSTFAADVDTGCYCNLRRMINEGENLSYISGSVRTEEMINYFDYDVEASGDVFSVKAELSACPWNEKNGLLIMTVQADDNMNLPDNGSNFVFLIDTSGSMDDPDKIDMAIEGFKMLAENVNRNDRISVVTYAGSSVTLLEGSHSYKDICDALDEAEDYCKNYGGGTNGSGGIEAAYECATENFIENGNNRVIIASDGDMNLGITTNAGLTDLIKEKKESGVFLTVLGYGSGNYSDANMESLADAGNGNYYYIDNINEAKRVLADKLNATTITVAKDVKFQAEFNPAVVASYRQIGYENRQMSASDFSDDTKDGGEVGAGQQVTVVYEITYADGTDSTGNLKYQTSELTDAAATGDLLTLSVRYKDPDKDESELLSWNINPDNTCVTDDFDFVASIVETSMIIRGSEYIGNATYETAYSLAVSGAGNDETRMEFCDLVMALGY